MKQPQTLDQALTDFTRSLAGRNFSPHTTLAYQTDVHQFLTYLVENDITVVSCQQVTRNHIVEYLSYLSDLGRSGVTRARKVASLREFFKFLVETGTLPSSPAATITMPKKERKSKVYLRPDEYSKMLAAAGGNPRDFCILQFFLQTGIRVSELIGIMLEDLDQEHRILTIHGKGKKERVIPLEKKSMLALKSWLKVRPNGLDRHVFLNYRGEGLSIRGVRKVVDKYLKGAEIQKKISCHGLRHTFGTTKAVKGMNAFQIQQLLGHSSMETTKLYVNMGGEDLRQAMEQTSL